MTRNERDEIVLKAAIEFGPDHLYRIDHGTLGLTLYAEVANKTEARAVRTAMPIYFEKIYTVVLYESDRWDEYSSDPVLK